MNAYLEAALALAAIVAVAACTSGPGIVPDDAGVGDGGTVAAPGVSVGGLELIHYPEVERCRASAARLSGRCPGAGPVVTCHAAIMGDYCHPDGRPGLLADALDCLHENSSPDRCQTFTDPRGAAWCVDDVYGEVSDSRVLEINRRATELCMSRATPIQSEPPLYSLAPDVLAALEACLDSATSCEALHDCFDRGPWALFAECDR